MANTGNSDKWYFTKEQLESTPSRKCGYDSHKELSYRQQAANFIQDMGQRLKVSQLCINTAIVYMHRFYVFHSFTHFPWHQMAAAALFLAAKVEEQPRKLEYVIKVSNMCRNSRDSNIDINSDRYISQSQDLVFNENVLLQTLGFDVAIDHPHTHVVRCCHLVRASKDLAQTSYFMASNSLHLTTMCIQYRPTVVACFCILVACKWSNWEIPLSNEKKEWYSYVDPTVTADLLQQLTEEFLVIFEACPSRLKEKIMAIADVSHTPTVAIINSPFDTEPRKKEDPKDQPSNRAVIGPDDPHKHRPTRPHDPAAGPQQQQHQRDRQKERLAAHHQKTPLGGHAHHRPPIDPKFKQHQRPPGHPPTSRDHPFKHNLPPEGGVNNFADARLGYGADKQRAEANSRPRSDASKVGVVKPDGMVRRVDADSIKKHLSATGHDRRPPSGSSHKLDQSKSVPKQNLTPVSSKSVHSSDSGYGSFVNTDRIKTEMKTEPIDTSYASYVNTNKVKLEAGLHIKEEIPTPAVIKRPSLFSPEKTPPHKLTIKTSPDSRRAIEQDATHGASAGAILSPLVSPVDGRRRTSSSTSESELRPVMKKIDQVEGFENLMRDSTIGIDKYRSPERKDGSGNGEVKGGEFAGSLVESNNGTVSRTSSIINGMETNPTIISNLLKEASAVPHLSAVMVPDSSQPALLPEQSQLPDSNSSSHHHKNKKKNKEKHRHKDKDKSREEKDRKKKNKYKDREKHKHKPAADNPPITPNEPIKLKITMDKPSQGLKIKIPKNKINTENITELSSQQLQPSIKLKISKEVLNNCPNLDGSSIRKRERDPSVTPEAPPHKSAKTSSRESKANGKHSGSKVSPTVDRPPFPNRTAVFQTFPPPPPPPPPMGNSLYYYNPILPDVRVPPPNFGVPYPYYPGYGNGVYQQPFASVPPPPPSSSRPPLPIEAPPRLPPPPPPE
ncbi:unnamed protein product [Phaedon cochleariae]|uniref:Cyclin-like domain-containing protein n=1 Tax=Phaedon cochleariae TaxID=80249 RepID=A0A9P0GNM8_PHACE|nr:unnamed protein product [Phaedon cochleariae]